MISPTLLGNNNLLSDVLVLTDQDFYNFIKDPLASVTTNTSLGTNEVVPLLIPVPVSQISLNDYKQYILNLLNQ
ncbi:unnamed protein product [Rotaria sordida]|uniref:Uncharacterized protein n=1 Tax=Rotaria sordida TaxID=392033 RepID=A0A819SPS1_9BILA|nr:unnamed protein product [Rotaria sordida]CAF4055108.1 unnamed protein product [Rotaria sordida]